MPNVPGYAFFVLAVTARMADGGRATELAGGDIPIEPADQSGVIPLPKGLS